MSLRVNRQQIRSCRNNVLQLLPCSEHCTALPGQGTRSCRWRPHGRGQRSRGHPQTNRSVVTPAGDHRRVARVPAHRVDRAAVSIEVHDQLRRITMPHVHLAVFTSVHDKVPTAASKTGSDDEPARFGLVGAILLDWFCWRLKSGQVRARMTVRE